MKRDSLVLLGTRLLLGAVFLYLGVVKALDPADFLKLVRAFHIVESAPMLNLVAAVLPWLEVFCGALLLLGIKIRAAALVQLGLLVVFTAAVAWRAIAIHRMGATPFCAIRFDCGCGTGEMLVCMKLVENTGLMLLAALLVLTPPRRGATVTGPVTA
jgi:uncharacterized membrane protein YphA (DoxX/SURF4 family)